MSGSLTDVQLEESLAPQDAPGNGAPTRTVSRFRVATPPKLFSVVVSLVLGLAVWEAVAHWWITNRLFFVPFSTVMQKSWELIASGTLWPHLYVSSVEFGLGLGVSIVLGILFGSLMAASKFVDQIFEPWVSGLYAAPLVALTPFFVLVLGIGVASKVALVVSLAVFPVLINTRAGILAVEATHLEVARSFSAPRIRLYREVLLPSALPYIVTGVRLAVGKALVGVVMGEILFAKAGVGFLIAMASQTFDLGTLFAGVLVFSIAGVGLTAALKAFEKRIAPWRFQTTS